MTRWFRMYDDLLDDPKVQRLPPALFKAWVNMLCLASKNGGSLPSIGDIAFSLRVDDQAAHSLVLELVEKGLIDSSVEAGGYTPHNWDKRQYKSDRDETAADRQRRKRDKGKQSPVTDENVTRDVTDKSHPPETEQNRTDSDPPKAPKGAKGGDGFQEFWEVYPKRDGSSDMAGAKLAFYEVTAETPPDVVMSAAVAYAAWCVEHKKTGTPYVKTAKAWLEKDGWREWIPKAIAVVPTGVLVKPNTPQWTAWQAIKKTPVSERYGGWYFPTEWPPGMAPKAQEVAA